MAPIRTLFSSSLRLSLLGAGTVIAGALFLGLAAAQAPSGAPTDKATGDTALNGASLDYFPRDHLFRILGKEVLSAKGEDMGRIVDVLFDEKGEARAAVIDFGGFLGVGSRKIVVDWNALHFGRIPDKGESITLELTKEQVIAAPEYKDDTPIVVLGASGSLNPWQFDR